MLRSLDLFFFFAAFLLLLLTSLSLPIIKSIKLFDISLDADTSSFLNSGVEGGISFGVWGYCVSDVVVQVVGLDHTTSGYCTPPRLGYKIDSRVTQLLRIDLADSLDDALTLPLVLHPIICGFVFLVVIFVAVTALRQHRGLGICTLLLAGFALVLTMISFIIDICLVAITRSRVTRVSNNLHVGWGAIPWMVLVAAICLMIGCVTFFLSFLKNRRSRKNETY